MRTVAALSAPALALAAGCGGDDDDEATPQSGDRETTTTAPAEPLEILVTNDDGVGAEGIDVLVTALTAIDGVEVTVVAPATQQSGTGGNVTDGPLTTNEATTASGYEARVPSRASPPTRSAWRSTSWASRPTSSCRASTRARTSARSSMPPGRSARRGPVSRRGVPALAVSQGVGQDLDYEVAAGLVDRLGRAEHLDALRAGEMPIDAVANLNVPTCDTGEQRGLRRGELGHDRQRAGRRPTARRRSRAPTDDVIALANGFAALTEVPVEPAA